MLSRRPALAVPLLAVFALGVIAQQPPPKRPPEELLRLSLAAEKPGLAEPFTGITTNGRIESGLFPVRSTGVSTAAGRHGGRDISGRPDTATTQEDGLPSR